MFAGFCSAAFQWARSRRRKLLRLRKAARVGQAAKIYTTGILPATTFGGEIFGFNGKEMKELSSGAMDFLPPYTRTVSQAQKALLHNDPAGKCAFMATARLAREVWGALTGEGAAFMTMPQLIQAWEVGCRKIDHITWSSVKGPVGAISKCAQRLGWKVQGTHEDDEGRQVQRHHARSIQVKQG